MTINRSCLVRLESRESGVCGGQTEETACFIEDFLFFLRSLDFIQWSQRGIYVGE